MLEDSHLAPMPRNLLDAMQAAGLDTAALAARLSIAPERLETGLSRDEMDRFADAAWAAIGDPTFGLRAGGIEPRPERFSVVGFAAMTSPTLEVALTRVVRYVRLIWGDHYELCAEADRATLRMLPSEPERPYTQGKLDFELASLASFGKTFTRQKVKPLQVGIRGKAPFYAKLYTELLDCPVRFEQPEHSICFSRSDLELGLISANPKVAKLFEECAEKDLSQWHDVDIAAQVRAALRDMLRGDEPTLAKVATTLHVSTRTLQRRLAADKVSFRDLLDSVRRELAEQYLRSGLASLMEISYLLGFADPNSFFRAFKRWTGTTPDVYRNALSSSRAANPHTHKTE
jgi:AraC-like DNA-binding protein